MTTVTTMGDGPDDTVHIAIPRSLAGRVRDAVYDTRKNYEEEYYMFHDEDEKEPDEKILNLRELERQLDAVVF